MTTTDDLLPEKLNPAEKRMLHQYEAEADEAIKAGDKAYALLGRALWDIQTEQLYRGAFAERVKERFGISKSAAYRAIEIAKAHAAHPLEPILSQYAIEAARPKRPKVGTDGDSHPTPDRPVPAVIDADWSEEVEPKALPAPAHNPHVRHLGLPDDDNDACARIFDAWLAEHPEPLPSDQAWSPEWRMGSDGPELVRCVIVSVPGYPIQRPSDPLAHAVDAGIVNDAAWNSANVVKPAEMTQAEYDAWTTKLHDDAKARLDATDDAPTDQPQPRVLSAMKAFGYVQPAPSPVEAFVEAFEQDPISDLETLIELLTCADLDAIGREMTEEQDAILTAAHTEIHDAWCIAHKSSDKLSKAQRVKRSEANGRPPVAPRSGGALDRREVEPRFKQARERVAR